MSIALTSDEWENSIRNTITSFPKPHRDTILEIWSEWLQTNPEPPLYESWSEFASLRDDPDSLFTETRIYIKRVTNELKDLEIPKTIWQKIAKALAAVASVFLVIFLAISRAFRSTE